MENRGDSASLRTTLIVGIVVVVLTIILAAAVVISELRRGQSPVAATPAVIVVTATATHTPAPPPPATPTLTSPPSATPVPSPTPTPTPTPLKHVTTPTCKNVSGEALSVRMGPGMEYEPPLGALSPQEVVEVVGKNAQDVTWWKVQAGELKGWVSAGLCVGEFEPNRVPIIYVLLPTPSPIPSATPTIPTRQPTPTPVPLTGRLYFPVYDPEKQTYHIFSANLDGGDRQLVASEASQPALDATGQRIAYKSWKADDRGSMERGIAGGEIWIFDPYFEGARAVFSPDGGTLLFHSREAGDKPAIYRTVFREHEVLRREAHPIQGEAPAWLPNGNQFVYKGCLGNHCGILLSNLDGSFPQQLTQNLSDTNPAVSPDGQTIAFMSQPDATTWDVYTMRIDGSGRTRLTADPANDGLPVWSPDGKTLVFVSDRGGQWAMWAMDADGGNQRRLFELGGSIDGQVTVDVQNSHGWLEESIAWAP